MGLSRKKKKYIKIRKREEFLSKRLRKFRVKRIKLYLIKLKKLKYRKRNLLRNYKNYFYNNSHKIRELLLKKKKRRLFYNIKYLLSLFKKKPTTPSKRHWRFILKHRILKKNIPLKSKLILFRKQIGKNNYGQIVSFHRQVGLKRRFRLVTNYRVSLINQGVIEQLEYNPNHSCLLARVYNPLLNYHFYIRSPNNLKIGFYITTNINNGSSIGDSNNLYNLTPNRAIHNLNLVNKNNIARSAGSFATILQKYKNYCLVQFPSKRKYYVLTKTQATLGRISNIQQKLCNLGKAGRNRWLGRRPHVRGVAMNPIDHPHGGGQGKTCGGQPSVSAWGKPTKQIKHRPFFRHSQNKKKVINLITEQMIKKKEKRRKRKLFSKQFKN